MERSTTYRKGGWTKAEDDLLKSHIEKYGLNRCRRSCRQRWVNYLKPSIKTGKFEDEEVDLIVKMHRLLGNRWSLIAGRIPGRTANSIKNYWKTHHKKKTSAGPSTNVKPDTQRSIIKPTVYKFGTVFSGEGSLSINREDTTNPQPTLEDEIIQWEKLLTELALEDDHINVLTCDLTVESPKDNIGSLDHHAFSQVDAQIAQIAFPAFDGTNSIEFDHYLDARF